MALDREVSSLMATGTVKEVLFPSSPGCYGRIFVVETPSSSCDAIHPDDWAISIDLRDADFHLLIHPRDRKFLQFVLARQGVAVQGPSLWPSSRPLGFHQGSQGPLHVRKGTWHPPQGLSGRLASVSLFSDPVLSSCSAGVDSLSQPGLCDQRGEVRSCACPAVPIFGICLST